MRVPHYLDDDGRHDPLRNRIGWMTADGGPPTQVSNFAKGLLLYPFMLALIGLVALVRWLFGWN